MTTINLIVPTIAETQLTGFVGGMEKTYRGSLYRAEIHPAGWRLLKDGKQLRSWDDLPAAIQKAAIGARDMLNAGKQEETKRIEKCLKDRCWSPVACNGFGYCRERNFGAS